MPERNMNVTLIRRGHQSTAPLPDCFVWPAGAGGDWLDRVRPSINSYAEVA